MIEYVSFSQYDMFFRCGEQYRRRYIEGKKLPPGIAMLIGRGLDEGANFNHRQKIITATNEPLSVIQNVAVQKYEDSITEEGLSIPAEEKSGEKLQVSRGKDTTASLVKVYHKKLAPWVQPTHVQEKIYAETPLLYDGYSIPIMGVLDWVAYDISSFKEGKWQGVWVGDIKAKSKKWNLEQAQSDAQMVFYHHLIQAKLGRSADKYSYECFISTQTPSYQQIQVEIKDDDYQALLMRIQMMLNSIAAGNFPPASPGRDWVCNPKWCGYYSSCPYIPAYRK